LSEKNDLLYELYNDDSSYFVYLSENLVIKKAFNNSQDFLVYKNIYNWDNDLRFSFNDAHDFFADDIFTYTHLFWALAIFFILYFLYYMNYPFYSVIISTFFSLIPAAKIVYDSVKKYFNFVSILHLNIIYFVYDLINNEYVDKISDDSKDYAPFKPHDLLKYALSDNQVNTFNKFKEFNSIIQHIKLLNSRELFNLINDLNSNRYSYEIYRLSNEEGWKNELEYWGRGR